MKFFCACIFFICSSADVDTHALFPVTNNPSPLGEFSAEWNKPQYDQCNTAADEKFMTKEEKEVVYILNLVRSFPRLFLSTVLAKYPVYSGKNDLVNDKYYYQSLVATLGKMEQQTLLFADKECYTSAACHAQTSGIKGYTGHERTSAGCKAKKYFMGECCDYGNEDPFEIVMSLLIDEGVASLGHRSILLGDYGSIGVAIRPHKTYGHTAVLDFY